MDGIRQSYRVYFLKRLSEEIKGELAARDDTFSLEELIGLATRLDNCLRERRRENASRQRAHVPVFQSRATAMTTY